MARKPRQLRKTLKSPRGFEFIKREVSGDKDDYREVRDHFRHKKTGIVMIRCNDSFAGNAHKGFIYWTCLELGGGTGSLSYWVRIANSTPRKMHGKK